MRLAKVRVLFLMLAVLGSARANDPKSAFPWKDKPFGEWDRADVRRVLYNSPWVRHFLYTRRDMEFEVPDIGPTGNELRGYHSKESKDDGTVTTEFYVRWVSSRTMRKAWARRQDLLKQSVGSGEIPPRLDDFEVAVAGRDMSSFDTAKESSLKRKCYLLASADSRTIAASAVEISRSSEGRVKGILFHFPRRTATGEPTISRSETKVWFIEYAGHTEIRVAFYPPAMADVEGTDL